MKKVLQLWALAAMICLPWATNAQVYLSEDFSTQPTGWTGCTMSATDAFAGNSMSYDGYPSWSYQSMSYDGLPGGMYYVNLWSSGVYRWIITPSIDLTGATNPELSFELALTQYSSSDAPTSLGSDDQFMVIVSTDDGATWSEMNATQWLTLGGSYSLWDIPTTFQSYTINLSAYIGSTIKIAFYTQQATAGTDNNIHIDNILVEEAQPCAKVSSLTAPQAYLTANSALLQWTDPNNSGATYVVKNGGTVVAGPTAAGVTQCLVSNLESNTEYTLTLYADCGSDGMSNGRNVTFRTPCGAITAGNLPYTCGFESGERPTNEYMPWCWTYGSVGTYDYPYCYDNSYYAYTGYSSLAFYSGTNSTYKEIAVLPEVDIASLPLSSLRLTFRAIDNNGYGAVLRVGTMSDPLDPETFTETARFELTSSYEEYVVQNFPTGTDHYIALRMDGRAASQYVYVDDLTLALAPDCREVANLQVTSLSDNSVTLSWESLTPGATYVVMDGSTEMATTAADATGCTINGLTMWNDYTFDVYTVCGGTPSAEASSISFTTLCGPELLPYSQDFESYAYGDIPNCWNILGYTTLGVNTSYAHNGSHCVRIAPQTSYLDALAYLPPMDGTTNTLQLKFYYRSSNTGSSYGKLQVGYLTNPTDAASFVALAEYDPTTSYTEATVVFASAPADAMIALRIHGNTSSGGNWYLDDFLVEDKAGCMPVSDLTVSNIASTSAILHWTDNNNGVTTYRITDGSNVLVAATSVGATSCTVPGLSPSTAYTLYVMANCAGDETSEPVGVAFSTDCDPVAAPYFLDFESVAAGDMPDCWRAIFAAGSAAEVCEGSGYAYLSDRSLRAYKATNTILIFPPIDGDVSAHEIYFRTRPYNTYGTTELQLGYLTDLDDTSSFVAVFGLDPSSSFYTNNTWNDYTWQLNSFPANARLAFRVIGDGATSSTWYIDNLHIEAINSCMRAHIANYQDVTSHSATITWSYYSGGSTATYTVKNGDEVLGTSEPGATSLVITGLTGNTLYDNLNIIANCSEYDHSYLAPVPPFTTLSDETEVLAFDISTPSVRRGDAIIYQHTVTMPIYWTEDFSSITGTFTISPNATAYLVSDEGYEYHVYNINNIRQYLVMDSIFTLRIYAEDYGVHTDWSLTLERENCTSPMQMTLDPQRASITVYPNMPDPAVNQYQVVWSATRLDEDYLNNTAVPSNFSGASYTIMGVDRGTKYYVYLRSNCGNMNYSSWVCDSATTHLLGCNLATIGTEIDAPTSHDVPLNTYYYYSMTQTIIDASELATEPATITSLEYFYNLYQSDLTSKSSVDIYLQPTTKSEFADQTDVEALDPSTAVLVFSGDFYMQPGWNSITFLQPFSWDGTSNVLVIVDDNSGYYEGSPTFATTPSTSHKTITWYSDGNNPDINDLSSFSGNRYVRDYRPVMRLNVCTSTDPCPTVDNIVVSNIHSDMVTASWDASEADYLGGYDVIVSTTQLDAVALDAMSPDYSVTETTLDITNLTELTPYYIYVRAMCNGYGHDEGTSTWAEGQFTTAAGCYAPVNGTATFTAKTAVTLQWQNGDPDDQQSNNFSYVFSATALDNATLNSMAHDADGYTGTTLSYNGLDYSTNYHLYVRNDCGANQSPWLDISFVTYDTMPAVVNLSTNNITAHYLTATWDINTAQYATEEAWQVAIVPIGETPTSWTVTTQQSHFFFGLEADTYYDIYVRPYIVESGFTGTATFITVTTASPAAPCRLVLGTDGSTTEYAPVYGWWADNAQRVQSIYPASLLEAYIGKAITSLHYEVQNGENSGFNTSTFNVSLGTTELENLSESMDNFTTLTQYYSGTITANVLSGMTITLDQPFVYNGGNLLIQFEEPVASSYNHVYFRSTSFQGGSRYMRSGEETSVVDNHLPMVEFCYEIDPLCPDVMDIAISNVTTTTADIAWMPGGAESQWQYVLSTEPVEESQRAALAQTVNTVSISRDDLSADMDYWFYVRPVCDPAGEVYGPWTMRTFQTDILCSRPVNMAATEIGTRTATLYAEPSTIGTPQSLTFRYWEEGFEDNKTEVTTNNLSTTIGNLIPNTNYLFDVKVNCTGAEGSSRWSATTKFTTLFEPLSLDEPRIYTFDESQKKDWVLVNGNEINRWTMGNAEGKTANGRSLYISNDGGTTNAYTFDLAGTTTYAYSAFTFEQGKQYIVEYQWKSMGDGNDYLRVWLVPDSYNFTAGVEAGPYSNWISLTEGNNLYNNNTWQRRVKNFFDGDLVGNYKLLFVWKNNNNSGVNPPAAIDSVVVRERERYTVTAIANTDANNTVLGTITGETGSMYVTTTVNLTASDPLYGYTFAGWYTGAGYTTLFRPGQNATFTLSQDTVLMARYDSMLFEIQAVAAVPPVDPGEVRGAVSPALSMVKYNLPVVLTATAMPGYHLVGWTDDTDAPAGVTENITVLASRNNTFTATFDTNVYTITAMSDNSMMGTATAAATQVKHFTSTTLTAEANYGYHFTGWTNEAGVTVSTTNPLTLSPVSDTTLTANFEFNQYTITAATANATMGSATGTETVNYLQYVTLEASANYGYHFVNWTDETGTEVGTTATLQVQATEDMTITANFDYNQYTVTGTSDNATMGSVAGTATVNYLTDVTLVATANYGYHFVNWTNAAGDELGTNATIVVQALRDSTLMANFDYNQYTVTGVSEDDSKGTVSGSATVNYLTVVTLTAEAATGYHLVNWTDGTGTELGTAATLQVQATEDMTVTAHFDINIYTITANIVSTGMGTVTGAVPTEHFSSATLTATANYGYHFINWTDGTGTELGTDATLTVWPTSDTTVNANFDYNQYTVTGLSADDAMGTVSGTATVNYLSDVVLTATAANGYHFVEWNDGDVNNPRTVSATGDITLTATFAITPAELAWSATDFTAYTFIDPNNWRPTLSNPHGVEVRYGCAEGDIPIQGGMIVGTNGEIGAPTAQGNIPTTSGVFHIYAVHETDAVYYYDSVVYELTVNPGVQVMIGQTIAEGGTVTLPGAGAATVDRCYSTLGDMDWVIIAPGSTLDMEAEAAEGYHLTGWQLGSEPVSTAATYTYTAPSDPTEMTLPDYHMASLTAVFDTNVYNITASVAANSTGMGSTSITGRHMHFLTDVVEAIPNPDCHFTEWSDGVTDNPRTVALTSDTTFEANFAYNQHTVTLAVNDETMGTANGAGVFSSFSEVTIEAIPENHYHFLYWQRGNETLTENPYTFILDADITFTAVFAIDEHTVSVSANNGSVTGAGTFAYGTTVVLEATPVSECYHFAGWQVGEEIVEMAEQYSFTLTGDLNIAAIFDHTNYEGVETVEACDSYTWHEMVFNESNNTATYSSFTLAGCDSTTTLNLTINYSADVHLYVSACESYTWNHVRRMNSGIFSHSAQTVAGCDSLTTLHLTINHASTGVETVEACDSYTWHGQTYTASNNEATFHTHNVAGCDSTVTLNLTINNSSMEEETVTACDGYLWNETLITESGVYNYTTTNVAGCDSTMTLNLTVNVSTTGSETATACDSYLWNGVQRTESGTYSYNTSNVAGCDSTVTLNLTINHSTSSSESITACDSYLWNGVQRTESGTYTYATSNVAGCDSTATLNLTINQSATSEETVAACDSYLWNGVLRTESGTYIYNTTTVAGCDSTATLYLTISQNIEQVETVVACDSYFWHGQIYTASTTTPTYTTTTPMGCTMTTTLHLTINASNGSTESAEACDSYTWHDNTITFSGTYAYTTTNVAGCDSVVSLTLTINHSTTADETVTACDSYTWDGNIYTASTVTTATMSTIAGCDSVVTLYLTVNNSTTSTETEEACDSHLWNGVLRTESGIYTYNTTNAVGCDSTVTLNLTVNVSTSSIDTVTATDSYTWIDGETYTASTNEPTYVLTNAAGCDSVVTLHLTIIYSTPHYNVTVATADATMGTVSPEGTISVEEGSMFTVTATALPGRHFIGWSITQSSALVTDNPLVVQVTEDMDITAHFEYDEVTAVLTVNDASMGTTDPQPGTYTFHVGETAHVRAIPNAGYEVAYWVVNGQTLDITDNEHSVEVTADMAGLNFTIEVVFQASVGITDIDGDNVAIQTESTRIIVSGAKGSDISVYDAVGRRVSYRTDAAERVEIDVATTGVYLVKVGNAPARRVAVVR